MISAMMPRQWSRNKVDHGSAVCGPQVGEECSKYGTVQRVVIFEVTEDGFPAELAVRIFIEFDRIESATKALVDLEGRFFGGRSVRANFYSEQKLDNDEVAPFEGEDAGQ